MTSNLIIAQGSMTCKNNKQIARYEEYTIYHGYTIEQLVNEQIIDISDVVAFKETKTPKWYTKVNDKNVSKFTDLGLIASVDNNLYCMDVDHVHEYPDAFNLLKQCIQKYFNNVVGTSNINPNKFKLMFKILGNKEPLAKYGQALNVVEFGAYGEKGLELFGMSKDRQAIKLQGNYSKETKKVSEEELQFVDRTFYDKDEECKHFSIGYSGIVDLIVCNSDYVCKFLDELIASALFVKWLGKKAPKQQEEVTNVQPKEKGVRCSVSSNIDDLLNELATAPENASNDTYLEITNKVLNLAIKKNISKERVINGLSVACKQRNIEDKIPSLVKYVEKRYDQARFFEDNKFVHTIMAKELINELHIKKYDKNLYYFEDKHYKCDTDNKLNGFMLKKYEPITIKQKNEVYSYLKDTQSIPEVTQAPLNYIAFNNGILDINTMQFYENTPNLFIQNIIPHNYNANAYNELLDKALNDWACNDKEVRLLLEEMIGYCLYRSNPYKKMFFLTGDKNNGKSTFSHVLKTLLGDVNYTSMALQQIANNRFMAVRLQDKLANICDDMSAEYINDNSQIKSISSGETITSEAKNKNAVEFTPYSKLINSLNTLPQTKDDTGAYFNRCVIIPFNADFSQNTNKINGDQFRANITNEDAMSYLINIAIIGLKRVLQNNGFTLPQIVINSRDDYERSNDNIATWLNEWVECKFLTANVNKNISELLEEDKPSEIKKYLARTDYYKGDSVTELYDSYKTYCILGGMNPHSSKKFSQYIISKYRLKSKVYRVPLKEGTIKRYFIEC